MSRFHVQEQIPTPSDNSAQPIDLGLELTRGFAARLIRRKVKQLVRLPEFSTSDAPDLEQELRVMILERAELFDPAVAHWNVYVTTLVERGIALLLDHHRAAKRDIGDNPVSLSAIVPDCDDQAVEFGETLTQADGERRTAVSAEGSAAAFTRSSDVYAVMASLPTDLRDLCARLLTQPVGRVARELGIPRSTMRDRLRELRAAFKEAISRKS